MCQFIEAMEGLKSSSNLSVANDKFSKFNKYMHIPSKMDEWFRRVITVAKDSNKSLVLVCGNSGDGKSHLIANFISQGLISNTDFDVYIDATSSDRKGKRANEKLREKLDEFSDQKLDNGEHYRLIVAINLGVLNDFIKNYENEYIILKRYVDEQGLFDSIPAWKHLQMNKKISEPHAYSIEHVDFTSFHRYEINSQGIDTSFFGDLLSKIVSDNTDNSIYQAYVNGCMQCQKRMNCPVYWNYKELVESKLLREHVVKVLVKTIIKGNLSPSVREINDYYYEIIIGRDFDESVIMSKSVDRLTHLVKNLSLWLLYESDEGILQYTSDEDVLSDTSRKCDKQIITLNLKPDFELWMQESAIELSPIFTQIFNDILYCKNSCAKRYKEIEQDIKQTVYKLYIRQKNISVEESDAIYQSYISQLYFYNIGLEDRCQEVIQLVEDCVYLWNGRLGDKSGINIKNGVIVSKASSRFYLFKKMEIKFARNNLIQPLEMNSKFPNFSSTMKFGFVVKESKKVVELDIDYELYAFLREVKLGFVPTNNDRKRNVKYDAFVRGLISESNSDIYVYARGENGRTYSISRGDFKYKFDYEV